MSLQDVKALTFDTGGTILDWHSGLKRALEEAGKKHGLQRDWHEITNSLRRRALSKILNLGEHGPPQYNFDDAQSMALDDLIAEHDLEPFTEEDRRAIAFDAMHNLDCWDDFPPILPRLRETYICASFTVLSYRIIMDTARRNNLSWDAVFSCEGIGKYKVLPEAYQTVSRRLQLQPSQLCMVACHNIDLDAARDVGFKTAYIRRPREWGGDVSPNGAPDPKHDIIADDFGTLADLLGVHSICTDQYVSSP